MNILIVGNGFDLSHYLPTKYEHFMHVMSAIESPKSDSMNFEDLFSTCGEERFIAKTKQYYKTEKIILDKEQLTEIRALLKENCWYFYLNNHFKEIDTWIDFENSIEEVLKSFSDYLYVAAGNKSITYDTSCQNLKWFNFLLVLLSLRAFQMVLIRKNHKKTKIRPL